MDDVILEKRTGQGLRRVAAVCTQTGLEAVVFGPAAASWYDLERLALAKLARMSAPSSKDCPVPPRRGAIA